MKKTLSQLWQGIKNLHSSFHRNNSSFFLPALIVLVSLASFGLGRLSAQRQEGAEIISAQGVRNEATARQNQSAVAVASYAKAAAGEAGKYVASKTGKKYHFPWCPGAQRISEGNKIWFTSIEAARAKGYTPAENCKGLQ